MNKPADFIKVEYGNRFFITIGAKFIAEVLKTFPDGSMLLYERRTIARNSKCNSYGHINETSNVTSFTLIQDAGNVTIPLNTDIKNEYNFIDKFYIKTADKLNPIQSKMNIKKLFPSKADAIDAEFDRKVDGETESDRYIRIISAAME